MHQRPMRADGAAAVPLFGADLQRPPHPLRPPYATEVEGYPGLVVHGPMQAALLCNYATELRGAPPKRFSFRGLSPLFDDDAFALHATEDGDGLRLWTAKQSGTLCMMAEAYWS